MDGISSQVSFSFSNLQSTVDDANESWQLLLRIVGDFSITVHGLEFYQENEFPVVEFAEYAATWLGSRSNDFAYVSMESDEEPLIVFLRQDDGRFIAFSPHQRFAMTTSIDSETLRAALMFYLDVLRQNVLKGLAIDIGQLIRFQGQ